MDEKIILGAVIGILSSAIGSLVTYLFHTLDRKKQREWDLEDKEDQANQQIYFQRLEEFEVYLEVFADRYTYIYYQFIPVSDSDIHKKMMQDGEINFPLLGKTFPLYYLMYYFDDAELEKLFDQFVSVNEDIVSIYTEYKEELENGEVVDKSGYRARFTDVNFLQCYSNLIERIDYLKSHYRK